MSILHLSPYFYCCSLWQPMTSQSASSTPYISDSTFLSTFHVENRVYSVYFYRELRTVVFMPSPVQQTGPEALCFGVVRASLRTYARVRVWPPMISSSSHVLSTLCLTVVKTAFAPAAVPRHAFRCECGFICCGENDARQRAGSGVNAASYLDRQTKTIATFSQGQQSRSATVRSLRVMLSEIIIDVRAGSRACRPVIGFRGFTICLTHVTHHRLGNVIIVS